MHDRKTLAQELGAGALNSRIEEVYGCTGQETNDYAERLVRVTKECMEQTSRYYEPVAT